MTMIINDNIDEDQSDSTTITTSIINNAETIALQCIHTITDFINYLRSSISEFDIVQHKKNTIRNISSKSKPTNASATLSSLSNVNERDWENHIGSVRLYSRIKEASDICHNIKEIYTNAITLGERYRHQAKDNINNNHNKLNDENQYDWDYSKFLLSDVLLEQPISTSHERMYLVQQILLPLLASLGQCYEILDTIPTPTNKSKQQQQHKAKNIKPIPPIGMLSLQNYTDIACFIEFSICTCIIPFLPTNILIPIQDRIRYNIPKTLSGRIPILSLLWASKLSSTSSSSLSCSSTSSSSTILFQYEWEIIICILGKLLLLDRFRPMLLPRHVTDIMSIILYCQEFYNNNNSNNELSIPGYQFIVDRWIGTMISPNNNIIQQQQQRYYLDTYWQVKAYQSLLRNGRSTPDWIRKSVAQRLSTLATYDLSTLITVYVHEAIDQDYSSASLRLAQALITKDMSSEYNTDVEIDQYLCSLCDQLLNMLDSFGYIENTDQISLQTASYIETVWTALDLIPTRIMDNYFFQNIVIQDMIVFTNQDILDTDVCSSSNIHRIVRRFANLLSVLPTTTSCLAKICRLFWKSINLSDLKQTNEVSSDEIEMTLLGMIIRLAASPSVMKSAAKDESIELMKRFAKAMVNIQFQSEVMVPGVDVLTITLLYSLPPSTFEMEKLSFDLINCDDKENESGYQSVYIRKLDIKNDTRISYFLKGVEDRWNVILQRILMDSNVGFTDSERSQITSLFFQTLLAIYFFRNQVHTDHEIPNILLNEKFQLVAMAGLPLLCENCSPEALLTLNGDSGIFDIMSIVLESAVSHCLVADQDTTVTSQLNGQELVGVTHRILCAEKLILNQYRNIKRTGTDNDSFEQPDEEMIASMTSIILSLLVTILELGAKSRSIEDENTLQSFVPALLALADSSSSVTRMKTSYSSVQAQIAEMASQAAALIVSRKVSNNIENNCTKCEVGTGSILKEAENDLLSDLPPLRARAMVLLRNRTDALSEQMKDCDADIDTSQCENDLLYILKLSIKALADVESYVYLAAVHTIVTVALSNPLKYIPIIAIAIVTGVIDSDDNSNDDDWTRYELSLEQRSKLTEALVFIVRRSNVSYSMLPYLIELLVYGLKRNDTNLSYDNNEAYNIHEATHRYFISDNDNDEQSNDIIEIEKSIDEYWNEVKIRVQTGGPLFSIESNDVVRSGMVLVVCELVTQLPATITAQYSSILIACCIDMLRLESSRPVRRAGAMLAKELYGILVREQDDLFMAVANNQQLDVVFSTSMIEGREEILFCILQNIVSYSDLHVKYNGMERLSDPAVVARCQEAISLRQQADDGGIILAGKIAIEAKHQDDTNPIARLIKGNDKHHNVTSIHNIKIEEL